MKNLTLRYLQTIGIITLLTISSCNAPNKKDISVTPQEKAKESILKWMNSNAEEYPKYQPLEFGEITARYERTDRSAQLVDLIETEKAKPKINKHKLDSLKTLMEKNKGLLLGYTLQHKYQTTSNAGELLKDEKLFFLDTSFHVLTILNLDAYDMILDQKLIFKPDSIEKEQK